MQCTRASILFLSNAAILLLAGLTTPMAEAGQQDSQASIAFSVDARASGHGEFAHQAGDTEGAMEVRVTMATVRDPGERGVELHGSSAGVQVPAKEEEEEGEDEEEDEEEEDQEEVLPLGERPKLAAGLLPAVFRFDGRINEPAWDAVNDSIADLTTVEPEEGETPAGRTVVKVLANKRDIVVGVRCYDADPDGIVSYSKARDSELEEEDHILMVFDTFLDGRSGYGFAVNAEGARFDALVSPQGGEFNSAWDTIWEARTARDESGWSAEIRIPIKSLAFKRGLNQWGFNLQRRVQRLQETSRWSGASQDFEVSQTSRAGLLTELPDFDFGVGLSIRPAFVGKAAKFAGEETEWDGDFSLDVTQRIGPNLLSALTVNTDFAETEVDARQVNLTRFEVFFPEKRSFFLEGADIFEFGLGLDEEVMVPFFSRRIGLIGLEEDEQLEIPINAGGKINGRIGNTNIGALVVNTRSQEELELGDYDLDVPQETMGAVRIKQNILEESTVGMIATFGGQSWSASLDSLEESLDRSNSWVGGVDFTYQTSSFLNEKNLLFGVWGLLNDGDDLEGDKSAFGLEIDYPNDLFDLALKTIRIGDGFDPALGFLPRQDVHIWDFGGEFNPRPAWPWLRQMRHELGLSVYAERSHERWESYEATIKPIDWLLESGESFSFAVAPEGDRPPEPFELTGNVDIAPGSYEWLRYLVTASSARKRRLSANLTWEFGSFYNGNLNTIEASLAIRPSAFFTLELSAERNDGKLDGLVDDFEELGTMDLIERDFTEELYGVRFQLNFTPDIQLSSFTQYDNESRELGSNNRLRWTFDRVGDLFVVYNHNLLRNEDDKWVFESNELPVKVQYALRF